MLELTHNYYDLCNKFTWQIPNFFNIGVNVCDRHADGCGRLALIYLDESQRCHPYTFDALRELSNRFANALVANGMARGDRIGVFLAQLPETAVAHVAAFKAGLISVPLFTLFGEQALEFRLADSAARAVVTDLEGFAKVSTVLDRLPALERIYVVARDEQNVASATHIVSFKSAIERGRDDFTPVNTAPDDPALIIYTSGTTGNPKGVLHAHRTLLGHLPGVELSHDFMPRPDDLFWTPADWAWIGGLLDVLMPAWHHGVPVLAYRARKFDPEFAMRLMAEHKVRNAFLPPTALKLMREAKVQQGGVKLRTVASGGESLGEELIEWGRSTFGLTINEFYGQTECNMVLSNNARLFPVQPGSMGRAVPGHDVDIVNEAGDVLPIGELGFIAIRRPNPVMFLEYWQNPLASRQKFAGDYLITGDFGRKDHEGYFTFVGRSDDLITSGGYRIGPSEVENCLITHSAVSMAAVVGVPDPIRGEAIKAWIVLRPGCVASEILTREIQEYVRTKLGAHEYPRHIAFVNELPVTATGKIMRRVLRERG